MKSIIKNGVTILEFPPQPKRINKKTGVLGTWISEGKYKGEICHLGKKYHLGSHDNLDDIKQLRETAELKVAEGTFIEWYAETFPPKQNKYGVMGLSFRKDRNRYALAFGYNSKKYNLGEYETIEEAAEVRQEAEVQAESGTFLEWHESRKIKKSNSKSI